MEIKRMREIKGDEFDGYKIGDIISFNLGDEEVEAMAMHKVEGGMVFALVDCLSEAKPRKKRGFDLNEWLNTELLEEFEGLLRKDMIPFEDGSMVRLMSEKEVFGENYWAAENEEGKQYEGMKLRRNRICGYGKNGCEGQYAAWWLRGVYSASSFCIVNSDGNADYYGASGSTGVRPAFVIRT